MAKYEFVGLIDPDLSSDEIEQEKKEIQDLFQDNLLDVDDI